MSGREARRRAFRDLLRLISFLRPFSGKVALSLVLGAGTVVSGAILLATASYLISAAALGTALVLLTGPIYAVRLSGVARAAFRYAERLFSHDATFHLLSDFRSYLYRRLEPLAPAQLTYRRSGDLLARVTKDVEDLQEVYLRGLAPLAVFALVALATGAFYALFSPALAGFVVALLVLFGFGSPALVWSLGRGLARREAAVRAELDAHLVDGVQGAQDLLAFGRAEDHAETAAILGRKLATVQRRRGAVEALGESLGELSTGVAALVVLLLAAPLVLSGEVRGVYLAALVLVALGAFEAVTPLGGALRATGRSLAAARRLFELADTEPYVREPDPPEPLPQGPLSIELRDVTFGYRGEKDPALRGVSLHVPAGGRVAVVGPSGSGKSTLAHLLLRFSDPDSGEVLLGGRDLRSLAGEDIRRSVGVSEQSAHVFSGTLRENLLLVRPEATGEELARAVRLAGLGRLLERLPEGLDATVGERGARLSGGERQRLALARVFLEDAPVLVLDEAASHLDAEAERDLARSVREWWRERPGRTVIHITHRLVGLKRMDEVLVLDGGRVVERGTHEELSRAGGLYARMLRVQRDLIAGDLPDCGSPVVAAEKSRKEQRGG
ncbi:CydC: thiol reductant ABC exporter, CydC subunit (plasmid) [Rubrobacter radiotolerans]|uniref:CydC: thiol reductant ABC exporter, CydC subunit n=1 Tax=Rubrobacter radiotolerans TaxID=42256 RepID=A0A023X7D8_RUBRA|nr:thiol reductant ABC exporter subunit CydC [Rubrobacter radiotolerans]AHY48352.1 CydC: thiol reductant ABC exporter, CydC subunit [Rubrobacter radiotolerans]MDX5895489.1 thiol reductant ABC exporter subunit CydC [Rubrobacter radiotolerans]SMC01550.1 ATP-binding cassette, subfamily C, CydC [Rubrobacter radiotolerans DSM 5868]